MQHFGAEDTVLAVLGLEVAIVAEATRLNPRGKHLPQLVAIAAEAGIENGDLDSLTAVAGVLPAIHAQKRQVASLVSVDGDRRRRLGVDRFAASVSGRGH